MMANDWPVYYLEIPVARAGWAEDGFEPQYVMPQAHHIAMEYELDCLEQNRRVAQAEDLPIKQMGLWKARFYASEYGLSAEVYVGTPEYSAPGYL